MMQSVWTKIVLAGLIILGDSSFASGSNQCGDDSHEANGNAVQLLQPAALDDAGPRWEPPLAGVNSIQTDINLAFKPFPAANLQLTALHKYHSFNPRAPPSPANQ
jgi:hypothetical protein